MHTCAYTTDTHTHAPMKEEKKEEREEGREGEIERGKEARA